MGLPIHSTADNKLLSGLRFGVGFTALIISGIVCLVGTALVPWLLYVGIAFFVAAGILLIVFLISYCKFKIARDDEGTCRFTCKF